VEEEESDLIQFMEAIKKRFADPTATKKRLDQTDHIIYYLAPSWSKRYCYKRNCAQWGKNVLTCADGRTMVLQQNTRAQNKYEQVVRNILK
jgi:hypothetical protein